MEANLEFSAFCRSIQEGLEQKKELKKYLEEEEADEVRIGGLPILTEEEVFAMTKSYISKLKEEHKENEKTVKRLDKYLEKFDIKKFMKKNPNMTSPDFYMVMYNETEGLINFEASNVFIYLVNAVSASSVKPPTNKIFCIKFDAFSSTSDSS